MNDYEVEAKGEFVVNGAVYNAIYPQIQKVPSVVSNFALVSAASLGHAGRSPFQFRRAAYLGAARAEDDEGQGLVPLGSLMLADGFF